MVDRSIYLFAICKTETQLYMKTSVCLTLYNEESSINDLIKTLLNQTSKPDEIVIVDGGSSDKTVSVIRHWQKKDKRIKLLVQKCTRAEGRNLSVELAKNEVIAITDGDCIPDKNWLKRITSPFIHQEIDMVAGFYKMLANTPKEKAMSYFLAVTPKRFNENFLPSTRSIAFRKTLWEKVGGFPEALDNSAEDTDFNYEVVKLGAGIARAKNAIVNWKIPTDLKTAIKKFYDYAKWDATKKIWWQPSHRFKSHNIKAVLKIFRYLLFTGLLVLTFKAPLILLLPILLLILYSYWAYRKVYLEFEDWRVGVWGILIQYLSDFAVMGGFLKGIRNKNIR